MHIIYFLVQNGHTILHKKWAQFDQNWRRDGDFCDCTFFEKNWCFYFVINWGPKASTGIWHPPTVYDTLLQYMTPSYSTWHPPTVYGCFYFVIYWGPKASRRAPTALCRSEKEGGRRLPESSRPKKGLKKMWSLSISDSPCFIFQQLDTTYL